MGNGSGGNCGYDTDFRQKDQSEALFRAADSDDGSRKNGRGASVFLSALVRTQKNARETGGKENRYV